MTLSKQVEQAVRATLGLNPDEPIPSFENIKDVDRVLLAANMRMSMGGTFPMVSALIAASLDQANKIQKEHPDNKIIAKPFEYVLNTYEELETQMTDCGSDPKIADIAAIYALLCIGIKNYANSVEGLDDITRKSMIKDFVSIVTDITLDEDIFDTRARIDAHA